MTSGAGPVVSRTGRFDAVVFDMDGIGVDRTGRAEAMREHGAHVVVDDLDQVHVEPGDEDVPRP